MTDTRDHKLPAYSVVYDYSDAPTLRAFALSNSRIRLVIGPFGSGKSSACVMEIIRRGHEQAPSSDGIRRTRWAVVRNCYSDDTEILTEKRGWQLFKDLLPDDKVASLVDDHLVFKLPNKVVSFPYKGDMIGFENEGVNFLVTPEHKMWVSTRRTRKKVWGNYEIKTAEEIYGNQTVRVKRNAKWKVTRKNDNLALFEWIGFWVAEGHANEYRYGKRKVLRCAITQKDNLGYVRSLFSGAGIPYRESKAKCGVSIFTVKINEMTKALIRELIPLGKACSKTVPKWIKESTSQQISSFIKGYLAGDGQHSKDGSVRASTGSKQLADDIQELALRAGMVVNISVQDHIGRESKINGITCRTNTLTYILTFLCPHKYNPILYVNKKTTNKLIGWHKKPYDGYVYCVEMEEVPVYVRRKGKGFWCVRSYNQLKDTTIKTFLDWFPDKVFGNYRITDHSYMITAFPGVQIEVLFRALDRPDQVSNLLSLELTGAWFNEAREIPKTIIEAMDGRIDRYPAVKDGGCTWTGIIMDTNPPDDDSYLYKMFEVVRPEGWEVFKQPSGLSAQAENTRHLSKNYYTNLARGKDEMYIRVYIHGLYGYILSGKPVFQNYVDNVHCAKRILEPVKGLPLIVGLDFGLQPACTIGQITPFGQLRILDELVSDGMAIKQFAINQLLPLLRSKYWGFDIAGYGDPAGTARSQTDESTCFDVLHSAEIGLQNVISAPTNSIVARVSAVDNFLCKMVNGEPGFLLSPNCRYLRKAMNGDYHYALEKSFRGGQQEAKDMPVKNFSSHICLSGGTMVLTPYGNRRIDSIKSGDEVVTPYGNRKVLASGKTAINTKVMQIKLSNGVTLKCTPDHQFPTQNKGIVSCNTLEYGDVLQSYNTWRTLAWSIRSLLSSKARNTGFRQGITTEQKTGGRERATCTERSGKAIMDEKFQPDMPYITLMGMCLTMTFPILDWFLYQSMPAIISRRESQMEHGTTENHLRRLGKVQKHGMDHQKDSHGIARTEGKPGKTESFIRLLAKFAERNLKHFFQTRQHSVASTVNQQQGDDPVKTTFKDRVLFVAQTLRRVNILKLKLAPKIVQISPCLKTEDVYNITVEHDHVYYANGILTCNCDSCEYLCLYIDEKQEYDKHKKALLSRLNQRAHHPASRIGGY